ncbi:hypothetical protein NM688_g7182 [Phlebia brevispora]|uniref:Uncharacterized protein n=1 Tax=Phlebia brevispora TaxID=194682 RepID=A0ACC1S856_9APHY|nr:hypothetical protein NM688_g7182 [Phlebia brevispora]
MSDSTDISLAAAEFQADLAQNYVIYASATLAFYEYILNFREEYLMIWRRKWTGVTCPSLANWYLMLALLRLIQFPAVSTVILPHDISADKTLIRCTNASMNTISVFLLLPMVIVAVFSSFRVFALTERNFILAAITLFFGLVPFVTNIWNLSVNFWYYVDDPVLGSSCYQGLTVSLSTEFDLFMEVPALISGNPLADITTVMQQILISRFIINLCRASDGPIGYTAGSRSFSRFSVPNLRVPTITAEDVLGPMGESLQFSGKTAWDGDIEDLEHCCVTEVNDDELANSNAEASPKSRTDPAVEVSSKPAWKVKASDSFRGVTGRSVDRCSLTPSMDF